MADYLDMLTQVTTEIQQMEMKLQQLNEVKQNIERLIGTGPTKIEIDPANPKPFADSTYGDAVMALITEHGPLSTRNLAELLLRGGVKTKSRNFVATLYSLLHKDGRFKFNQLERKWHQKTRGGK